VQRYWVEVLAITQIILPKVRFSVTGYLL